MLEVNLAYCGRRENTISVVAAKRTIAFRERERVWLTEGFCARFHHRGLKI